MVRSFDTAITTNDQSYDRVLAAGLPVVFVFLDGPAPTVLDQTMDRLAREYAGKLLIAKIQRKDNPVATGRYQITRTPALVMIRNGQVSSKAEGITAADLEKHVAFLLGKGPKPETARPTPGAGTAQQAQGTSGDGKPRVVTDATFEAEVLRSAQPVLVDFWAPWCGPCRMTEPIIEKLAHEMAGRVKVAKINVDENPAVAQRYNVQSIPTMMVLKNGQVADRWVGALPEPAMRNRIAPLLA